MRGYREQIASTLRPVRPLASPVRRAWMLAPIGLLLAVSAPYVQGPRGDLGAYAPLLTWGATALQALVGLWLLTLGLREAVPGRNVSRRLLYAALALSATVVVAITLMTNEASPTFVPAGRGWEYWIECVAAPMALGSPLVVLAMLLTARAFPTRPALTGALCGTAAGLLADAGWRMTCWISEPSHVIGAHGLAILGLATAGALLSMAADRRRWKDLVARVRRRS